jgi:hypothetical protein
LSEGYVDHAHSYINELNAKRRALGLEIEALRKENAELKGDIEMFGLALKRVADLVYETGRTSSQNARSDEDFLKEYGKRIVGE